MKSVGEQIIRLRKENGVNQEDLAEGVGVSRQTISKWECGKTKPNSENLKKICRFFRITPNELMGSKENGDEFCMPLEDFRGATKETAVATEEAPASAYRGRVLRLIAVSVVAAVAVLAIALTVLIGWLLFQPVPPGTVVAVDGANVFCFILLITVSLFASFLFAALLYICRRAKKEKAEKP